MTKNLADPKSAGLIAGWDPESLRAVTVQRILSCSDQFLFYPTILQAGWCPNIMEVNVLCSKSKLTGYSHTKDIFTETSRIIMN